MEKAPEVLFFRSLEEVRQAFYLSERVRDVAMALNVLDWHIEEFFNVLAVTRIDRPHAQRAIDHEER